MGDSDHSPQILLLPASVEQPWCNSNIAKIGLVAQSYQLHFVDWEVIFTDCITADDYANTLNIILQNIIAASTHYVSQYRKQRLSRHIVNPARVKKKS